MIKYETTENKYLYDPKSIDEIINLINSSNYYDEGYLTQENVSMLVNTINNFLNNIKAVPHRIIKEKRETEEEAREYFGQDFIQEFDDLLTLLDKQETIVSIHGTRPSVCPIICEKGLQYKFPSLDSTAVQQSMAYGQHDMHYESFESLLNWGHKNYKGLVILAIPYECYYKEGLWNHFQYTNSSAYGGQDYRIDPDFIAGYIDVNEKKIVINPKYNRNHNYDEYEKDMDIFREKVGMDNETIRKQIIESEKLLSSKVVKNNLPSFNNEDKTIDLSMVSGYIEILIGIFNSIKFGFPDGMTEDRYRNFLEELSNSFSIIKKSIPLLKTQAQLEQEQQRFDAFDPLPLQSQTESDNEDFDWSFDDWGEDVVQEESKSSKFM